MRPRIAPLSLPRAFEVRELDAAQVLGPGRAADQLRLSWASSLPATFAPFDTAARGGTLGGGSGNPARPLSKGDPMHASEGFKDGTCGECGAPAMPEAFISLTPRADSPAGTLAHSIPVCDGCAARYLSTNMLELPNIARAVAVLALSSMLRVRRDRAAVDSLLASLKVPVREGDCR